MKEQNYSNHKRVVPGFHFVAGGLILIILASSIMNALRIWNECSSGHCSPANGGCCLHDALMPILIAITLLLLFWYSRQFAIKAQDRAIRAEESLRHFSMTGKLPDSRLTMGQVAALRFAGDDEYLALSARAVTEQMKADDIKKAIKNWRADNTRC